MSMKDFFTKIRLAPTDEQLESAFYGQFYNPLGVRVHDQLTVLMPRMENIPWSVDEIREDTDRVGHNIFRFTDYVLSTDRPNTPSWRLRYLPLFEKDKVTGKSVCIMALAKDDETTFDQGLFDLLCNPDDEGVSKSYNRVTENLGDPHIVNQSILRDENEDGKVHSDEVVNAKSKYWFYSREMARRRWNTSLSKWMTKMVPSLSGLGLKSRKP